VRGPGFLASEIGKGAVGAGKVAGRSADSAPINAVEPAASNNATLNRIMVALPRLSEKLPYVVAVGSMPAASGFAIY
jgi:hypothetical protein